MLKNLISNSFENNVPTDSDDGIKNLLGDMAGKDIRLKLGGLIKNNVKF